MLLSNIKPTNQFLFHNFFVYFTESTIRVDFAPKKICFQPCVTGADMEWFRELDIKAVPIIHRGAGATSGGIGCNHQLLLYNDGEVKLVNDDR